MKRNLLKYALLGVLSAAIAFVPAQGFAQEKKNDAPTPKADAPKEGKKKREGLPARGKIAAVDKTAKTIKVGERVFHATSETRIRKDGQEAKLDDAKVGDEVGIYYKEVEGKRTMLTLRLGPVPENAAKGEKKKKKKEE